MHLTALSWYPCPQVTLHWRKEIRQKVQQISSFPYLPITLYKKKIYFITMAHRADTQRLGKSEQSYSYELFWSIIMMTLGIIFASYWEYICSGSIPWLWTPGRKGAHLCHFYISHTLPSRVLLLKQVLSKKFCDFIWLLKNKSFSGNSWSTSQYFW
jgi:hypothetical protein